MTTTIETPRLFNEAVFMPRLRMPNREMPLRYGRHALEAAQNDRYGNLTQHLPETVNPTLCQVVEAELTGTKLTKLVLRKTLGNGLDLVLVLTPQDGFVRTVWGQQTNDAHGTLNRNRYATTL
jgi:hypothetical protein